jgi:hypothetical protein
MAGNFTVEHSGFYQFVVTGAGKLSLAVDGRPLLSGQTMNRDQPHYFPLALEQGSHDLQIEFTPADNRTYLHVMLEGDQVATIPAVEVLTEVRKQANISP